MFVKVKMVLILKGIFVSQPYLLSLFFRARVRFELQFLPLKASRVLLIECKSDKEFEKCL